MQLRSRKAGSATGPRVQDTGISAAAVDGSPTHRAKRLRTRLSGAKVPPIANLVADFDENKLRAKKATKATKATLDAEEDDGVVRRPIRKAQIIDSDDSEEEDAGVLPAEEHPSDEETDEGDSLSDFIVDDPSDAEPEDLSDAEPEESRYGTAVPTRAFGDLACPIERFLNRTPGFNPEETRAYILPLQDSLKPAGMDNSKFEFLVRSACIFMHRPMRRPEKGTCSACNRVRQLSAQIMAQTHCACEDQEPEVCEMHVGCECKQKIVTARAMTEWLNNNMLTVKPDARAEWEQLTDDHAAALTRPHKRYGSA